MKRATAIFLVAASVLVADSAFPRSTCPVVTFVSECVCQNAHGVDRWAAKTDLSVPARQISDARSSAKGPIIFDAVLEKLEWLTKYGFLEIFFGLGVLGLMGKLIGKIVPSNYSYLDVNMSPGGSVTIPRAGVVQHSFTIDLRNSGPVNIYIARAYFRPKLRRCWFLWLRRTSTRLKVHPQAFRIANKDAFALTFAGEEKDVFTEYETLIRPRPPATATTWLPLVEAVRQKEIEKRRCGVLYIEYAARGKQGVHVVRL